MRERDTLQRDMTGKKEGSCNKAEINSCISFPLIYYLSTFSRLLCSAYITQAAMNIRVHSRFDVRAFLTATAFHASQTEIVDSAIKIK